MNLTVIVPQEVVFTVSCSAEGFPLPSISWTRTGLDGPLVTLEEGISQLSSGFTTTSNLTLSPTDSTLSGEYVCVATNEFGSENVSVTLEIDG